MGDDRANLLSRLHPTFYLAIPFIIAALLTANRRTLKPLAQHLNDPETVNQKWLKAFAITVIASIAAALTGITQGSVANLATTFLLPVAVAVGLSRLSPTELRSIARIIAILMLANSALGIFEKLTEFRLFTFAIGTQEKLNDPRPTAWFSHPLNNALLTAMVLTYFLYGYKPRSFTGKLIKYISVLVHAYALVCFGGRSAIVALICVVTLEYILSMGRVFTSGRGAAVFAGKTIIAVIGICAILTAYANGVFDDLADRFLDDGGSADVRWASLLIFRDTNIYSILTGLNPYQFDSTLGYYGIPTIELSWQYLTLKNGLPVAGALAVTLTGYLYSLAKLSGRPTGYMAIIFGVVTFGFTSIASASLLISQLIIMMVTLPHLTQTERQIGTRERR